MRAHYDFSKMKARRNPYVKLLKRSVTIRLDRHTVEYFKGLAIETGLPYQSLINLYLRDCAVNQGPGQESVAPHREVSAKKLGRARGLFAKTS